MTINYTSTDAADAINWQGVGLPPPADLDDVIAAHRAGLRAENAIRATWRFLEGAAVVGIVCGVALAFVL